MKKLNLFLASTFFLGLLFFAGTVYAQEKISNYQVDIQLDKEASLLVSEKIDYDFDDEQRHGIFRQIPTYYKGETEDFSTSIDNISVTDEQGEAYKYTSEQEGDYLVLRIGDAKQYVSGQKIYVINYRVQGAILFFDTYDELYWNAIGTDWPVAIEQAQATLSLPATASSTQSIFKCWSGAHGSNTTCQNLSLDTNTEGIAGLSVKQSDLSAHQALTILAQLPKGLLDEAAVKNLAATKEAALAKRMWGSPWFLLWPILVFSLMYSWWSKKGRDPKGRGNIIAEYDVPHDLRPAEVGAIVCENFNNTFLTAEIIYLASHGYLKIIRQPKSGLFSKEDFILEKIKDSDKSLKNYQSELLIFLFSAIDDKQQVKISDLKGDFYTHLEKWKKEVWSLLKTEKYYSNTGQGQKIGLLILGLALVFLAFPAFALFGVWGTGSIILSGLIVVIFSRWMPQKTQSGVLTKEYLLGLKEYLQVAEKDRLEFHNAPSKDPQTFEKLLPYAIVFGVENQWAEKFKDIYKTPPTWYSDSSFSNFNSILFISSLHNFSNNSIHSLATPTHSGAGGMGGGGGFSGGGFGGGGGGSW